MIEEMMVQNLKFEHMDVCNYDAVLNNIFMTKITQNKVMKSDYNDRWNLEECRAS